MKKFSNNFDVDSNCDTESSREQIRSWLKANCPESMKMPFIEAEAAHGGQKAVWSNPDTKLWLDRTAEVGLTIPKIPKEYGGAGLTDEQTHIYYEELERLGARIPVIGIGPMMLAPTILDWGTEEQKQRFLPPIASGEVRWAQGFSEPSAGSDLASLKLKADRDGDEYILNGQKTWNSHAECADWMIVLVRTNRKEGGPVQFGISFLLVDLSSPGITIQPMRMINGEEPFCETFFEDVRVPVANRIGPEDEGWNVIKSFLVHERFLSRYYPREEYDIDLASRWREYGPVRPQLWDKVANNELDQLGLDKLMAHIADLEAEGKDSTGFTDVFKCWEAEHKKQRFEVLMLLMGERGFSYNGGLNNDADKSVVRESLQSRAYSIGGGTTEIALNVIAKRVLNLPQNNPRKSNARK